LPIYEYLCRDCGSKWDVLQRIGDGPPAECRDCGSASLEKLVSVPAIVIPEAAASGQGPGLPGGPGGGRQPTCLAIDATAPREFRHPSGSFRLVEGSLADVPDVKVER
jgi:putative FmdB family regulatory protein